MECGWAFKLCFKMKLGKVFIVQYHFIVGMGRFGPNNGYHFTLDTHLSHVISTPVALGE